MAEVEEIRCEETISDVEQMEQIGMFEISEVRDISKKRKEFEDKVWGQENCKDDFLQYIQFEMDLLNHVNLRNNNDGSSFEAGGVITSIANRVEKLFKNTIIKFQDDVGLWVSYIEFCKLMGFTNSVNSTLVQMLQVHSNKPELWKVASNWEFQDCKSIENARQYLLFGLQVLPKSDVLYTEAFRLELTYADMKRKEESLLSEATGSVTTKPQQKTPLESILGKNKLLEGGLADAMYQSAVKKIDDIEFFINLLSIAKGFDFTQKLQLKIINDMMGHPRHRRNERLWDMMAHRELEGLSYTKSAMMFMDSCLFGYAKIPDKINRSLKSRILLCNSFYQGVLQELPTERMWSLYLETLIELNQDLALPNFKKNLLSKAFQEAHDTGLLQEKYYPIWVDLLYLTNKSNKLGLVLRQATEIFSCSLQLWQMRLCFYLLNDHEQLASAIFRQAISQLGTENVATLPLWMNLIQYYQKKSVPKAQKLFEDGFQLGTAISDALKPVFLEWLQLNKGIQIAWNVYEWLSLQPPLCLELHTKMIKLECSQPQVNLEHVRRCYVTACEMFGTENTDLWMEFVKFEQMKGDARNISIIYDQAINTLDPLQVETFVNKFSLI